MPTQSLEPGKSAEFAAFMQTHQDMVFSTAARLLADAAQAEDVAQAVFLKAFERFDDLKTHPSAPGWLRTVATNLSLNHLSRYRKRWHFFTDWRDEDAGEFAGPEFAVPDTLLADLLDEERSGRIERALERLPAHQRVPLVLFHFDELPYQDIARQLRVSVAKIKTDIFRGRATLAKLLEEHEP